MRLSISKRKTHGKVPCVFLWAGHRALCDSSSRIARVLLRKTSIRGSARSPEGNSNHCPCSPDRKIILVKDCPPIDSSALGSHLTVTWYPCSFRVTPTILFSIAFSSFCGSAILLYARLNRLAIWMTGFWYLRKSPESLGQFSASSGGCLSVTASRDARICWFILPNSHSFPKQTMIHCASGRSGLTWSIRTARAHKLSLIRVGFCGDAAFAPWLRLSLGIRQNLTGFI